MVTVPFVSGDNDTKPRIGDGRAGDGVFLVWSFGIWGQPVLPGGHRFLFLPPGWTVDFRAVSGSVAWWVNGTLPVGKRGLIRAGGPASRISNNYDPIVPGRGGLVAHPAESKPAWVLPSGTSSSPG